MKEGVQVPGRGAAGPHDWRPERSGVLLCQVTWRTDAEPEEEWQLRVYQRGRSDWTQVKEPGNNVTLQWQTIWVMIDKTVHRTTWVIVLKHLRATIQWCSSAKQGVYEKNLALNYKLHDKWTPHCREFAVYLKSSHLPDMTLTYWSSFWPVMMMSSLLGTTSCKRYVAEAYVDQRHITFCNSCSNLLINMEFMSFNCTEKKDPYAY